MRKLVGAALALGLVVSVAFYAAHASIAWAGLGGPMSFAAALTATLISAWGLEHFGFATMRRNQASPMFVFIFTIVTSEFVAYLAMLLFGTWPKTVFPHLVPGRVRLPGPAHDAGRRGLAAHERAGA